MDRHRAGALPWLLGAALCAASAGAQETAELPLAALGPILTGVSPDGFSINLGQVDAGARTAALLVFDGAARPGPGAPPLRRVDSAAAAWHRMRVGGLAPAHRYRYRVLLGGAPVGDGEVSTAPPDSARRALQVAIFGDERGAEHGVSPYAPAIIRAVLAEAPDLAFGTGDLVTMGGDPDGWRMLLRSHGPLLAQVPYFPALGNHELIGDPEAKAFSSYFPQAARGFYAVRYAQLLVLMLNGNRPGEPAQGRFLDEELGRAAADPTVRRRLVILHHSPLSVGAHCGLLQAMAPWIERFERHHVDAVFSGHDHTYQRLERNGVAYFVTGGAGAPLYPEERCAPADHAAVQRYAALHHYVMLRIDPSRGDAITVIARAPQGPILDEVTLPLPRTTSAPAAREPVVAPARAAAAPPGAEGPQAPGWRAYLLFAGPLLGGVVLLARRRRARP